MRRHSLEALGLELPGDGAPARPRLPRAELARSEHHHIITHVLDGTTEPAAARSSARDAA